ncbi:hypothetical protein PV328_010207 [Microctonus aethiopoides]|uniref:Acyl-CoA synthetase family member 4 n=1 Tax=Microctonus aethiopoides TaxID=144406 RepID=A0AA39EXJ2_9HYME|nr:hypothetical protein PV328_010207 [Microctonus aethiopoides]
MDLHNKSNLMHVCNWNNLENVAIEHHHSINNSFLINYFTVRKVERKLRNILNCIELSSSQFIGISSNIPTFCIPTLILGIISSGRAFVYLSEDSQHLLLNDPNLNIQYIFSSQNSHKNTGDKVIKKFVMHKKSIVLIKISKNNLQYHQEINSQKTDNIANEFAYAITTSGSTGVPSIVRVTHASIVSNILDLRRILNLTSTDKIAHLTPLTFDPSIIEIFLSISSGATLVTVSDKLKNYPHELLMVLHNKCITFISSTPSLLLHRWSVTTLNSTILGKDSHLRVLLLGGEPFLNPRTILKMKHRENCTRIFNIYGITEISCWASINEIIFNYNTANDDNDDDFNNMIIQCNKLGTILSATLFQVKDLNGDNIIKEGQGLLYIGSDTRICAIDNEIISNLNPPVFRCTGDIVTIDKIGEITFDGRQDCCVKRFGKKIYLNQLECHLKKLNLIEDCHTIFNYSTSTLHLFFTTINNEKQLSNDENTIINMIWTHLRKLPPIMHPDYIRCLKKFKVTEHGKICKDTLRKLSTVKEYHNDIGNYFESIWKSHLPIIINDKTSRFVDTGGTSIIALEISSKLTDNMDKDFPLLIGMLLENKTLSECRNYVVNQYEKINSSPTKSDYHYEYKKPELISNRKNIIDTNKNCQWQKCKGKFINFFSTTLLQETLITNNQSSSSLLFQGLNNDDYTNYTSLKNIEFLHLYNLTKCVDASPTLFKYVSNDDIFVSVGSHSGIICTVQISNNYTWKVKLPGRIEASILIIDNFKGIVGCHDGFIYCVHLMTGEIHWKFQTYNIVKCLAVMCSQRQNIFFGSYDHYIYCLSMKDGSLVWKQCAASACATPLIDDETMSVIFVLLDGNCISLDQITGKIRWKYQLTSPIFSSPTFINNNKILIIADVNGNIVALRKDSGEKLWNFNTSEHVFSDLVTINNKHVQKEINDGFIIATKSGNVYRYDFINDYIERKLTYKINCKSSIFASPWIDERFILIAQENGELQFFNLNNGTSLSTFKLRGECFSSPVFHQNLIFVGSRDNNLCILKTDSKLCQRDT